jgi:putative endonuclease
MSSDLGKILNKSKGSYGENIAADYLESKNYKIIKRNFVFGKIGEIDLIAQDGKVLVFVEVKLRTNNTFGDPLDSIDYRKQKNLKKTAEGYYYVNKINDMECRFDVIVIDIRNGMENPSISHLVNAM